MDQLPTPYDKKIKVSKLRSNQGHIMMLHTYTPQTKVPTKYQLYTPYSFPDIAQTSFNGQGHYNNVKGQIKVTP